MFNWCQQNQKPVNESFEEESQSSVSSQDLSGLFQDDPQAVNIEENQAYQSYLEELEIEKKNLIIQQRIAQKLEIFISMYLKDVPKKYIIELLKKNPNADNLTNTAVRLKLLQGNRQEMLKEYVRGVLGQLFKGKQEDCFQ